uniref:Uncharacterized protein n=1 Tax=Arundo donax TaxID=35708 RepID=A0A0A9BR91_ARUDO
MNLQKALCLNTITGVILLSPNIVAPSQYGDLSGLTSSKQEGPIQYLSNLTPSKTGDSIAV